MHHYLALLPSSLITQSILHLAIVIVNAIGYHLMCIVDRLKLPYDGFLELIHKHFILHLNAQSVQYKRTFPKTLQIQCCK